MRWFCVSIWNAVHLKLEQRSLAKSKQFDQLIYVHRWIVIVCWLPFFCSTLFMIVSFINTKSLYSIQEKNKEQFIINSLYYFSCFMNYLRFRKLHFDRGAHALNFKLCSISTFSVSQLLLQSFDPAIIHNSFNLLAEWIQGRTETTGNAVTTKAPECRQNSVFMVQFISV